MSSDRLPSLPPPLPYQADSSNTSSPRVGSIASSISSHTGSLSSYTSVSSSNGPKTPSPTLPAQAITGPATAIISYDAMNQSADMYYPQHMSAGQPPPPQTVTSGLAHYSQHQPQLLPPGPSPYSNQAPYSQYGYANGLTSPPAAPPSVSNPMGNPSTVLPSIPGVAGQAQYVGFDTTGQQPPPGMKPRVTATLWEDEGSLCFQVEARGICVARREDNHMINGTKLLNVAGMTRGRRDGILKSEKVRHVVKIGPMHLKGVWIPYERALDFANKEKITEMLYPLFVHNIGALLYHPSANPGRTSQVMTAADRQRRESVPMRNPPPPGLPSIGQHHPLALPGPQQSLSSQSTASRPPLDRALTFPTPPTSASSVMGSMATSEGFNWPNQGMNGSQGGNSMTMDGGLNSARSMPNTPAATPPGSIQSMQSYSSAAQGYDNQRQMYNAPPSQQSPYQNSANPPPDRLYSQPGSYQKNEMAPPASRPPAAVSSSEQPDNKGPNGISAEQQNHNHPEEEGEHEAEYTHDSASYDHARAPYNYNTGAGVASMNSDANMPSEMASSQNHPPASGRATPRTAPPPQPYYQHHTGYNSPQRVQQSTSNLYNVMTSDRAPTNGGPGNDVYAPPADMSSSMSNGYATQPPVMNGSAPGMKRGRDDEDDIVRPTSDDMGNLDLKRRKTMMETTVSASTYDTMSRPASAIAAPRRR
ncbi:hypothetical protein V8C37DRAFT_409576 [Trichoderma ceciliae]